jgi:hypothetical protein
MLTTDCGLSMMKRATFCSDGLSDGSRPLISGKQYSDIQQHLVVGNSTGTEQFLLVWPLTRNICLLIRQNRFGEPGSEGQRPGAEAVVRAEV